METIDNDLKKAIIRNIIYLIIVIGLTALAFYLTIGNNVYAIGEVLKQANLWYIVAIFGVVLGCILCRSIAIFTLTRINLCLLDLLHETACCAAERRHCRRFVSTVCI